MRKFFAAAAATAGIMAIGLTAAPAQATAQGSDTQKLKCFYTNVLLADFHVVDSANSGVADGLFGISDLQAIKKGKVPASGDLRAAASMLVDFSRPTSKSWFKALDVANRGSKRDLLIAPEDLRAYLNKYCP